MLWWNSKTTFPNRSQWIIQVTFGDVFSKRKSMVLLEFCIIQQVGCVFNNTSKIFLELFNLITHFELSYNSLRPKITICFSRLMFLQYDFGIIYRIFVMKMEFSYQISRIMFITRHGRSRIIHRIKRSFIKHDVKYYKLVIFYI